MRIAFAGNPNSGKTTMYNALTGRSEKVGNWAGVTVGRKEFPVKEEFTRWRGSHCCRSARCLLHVSVYSGGEYHQRVRA